jgi:hypothetical protein
MVIGGGGTSVPSNQLFFNPPACRVITAVGEPDATLAPQNFYSRLQPIFWKVGVSPFGRAINPSSPQPWPLTDVGGRRDGLGAGHY